MNVKRVFKEDVTLKELMESVIYLYWDGITDNLKSHVISNGNGGKSVTHTTTYSNLNVTDVIA